MVFVMVIVIVIVMLLVVVDGDDDDDGHGGGDDHHGSDDGGYSDEIWAGMVRWEIPLTKNNLCLTISREVMAIHLGHITGNRLHFS